VEAIQSESLVDAVADRVRQAILAGDMQPGEPIRARVLQEQLGISHIPIREAIRQLEAEGLVVVAPRRTPQVAGVGLEELAAIYELRRLIEIPTVHRAREVASEADVVAVRDAYEAFERIAMDTRSPEYWASHTRFHWALVAAGANSWTRRVLDPLWRGSERYVRLFVAKYATPDATLQLHRVLLEAYETGDPDEIAAALLEHFRETERGVREAYLAAGAAELG